MATTNIPFRNSNSNININQIEEPLFDQSLNDDYVVSPMYNIKGILKKQMTEFEEIQNKARINQLAKYLSIATFITIYLPIIICNLYFAYTDKSCVLYTTPKFSLNIYDYLMGESYIMFFTLNIIVLSVICEPDENSIWKFAYDTYIISYKVFSMIWLVIGIIIFWFIIDNKQCNHSLYYYMLTFLTIKMIGQIINIIIHYKEKTAVAI